MASDGAPQQGELFLLEGAFLFGIGALDGQAIALDTSWLATIALSFALSTRIAGT